MTAGRRLLALLLALIAAAPAAAQPLAVSRAPERVSVTVYRDPGRSAVQPMNLRWLNGFALISETRRVTIPAGESEIRFEGVAGGILPQSAIVSGLPEGMIERNRDAYLLSPGSLLDRSLGQRVHLRRTSRATGAVTRQEAVVRSGAGGAVVLETGEGFETLRCTGLAETLVYDRVPQGLSARPTLAVRARAARTVTATVTLSYIAGGFDWQADYVADLAPDGRSLRLLAWLTLANGDETGFRNAEALAVAGRLNRTGARANPPEAPPLTLRCWSHSTTSDIPKIEQEQQIVVTGSRAGRPGLEAAAAPPPPPPPPPPPAPAMVAEQEDLGDLKLYRIPEPVTVAARSQKQVALMLQPRVRVAPLYRITVEAAGDWRGIAARRLLVTRNLPADGLGLPLPAGRIVIFSEQDGRRLLVGQGSLADRAVGEEVEIELGTAPGLLADLITLARTESAMERQLTVSNDRNEPVRFEAELTVPAGGRVESDTPLTVRNGQPLWSVSIPANGRIELRYRLRSAPAEGW